ncbi:ATP-binding protein [Paenibacillus frigoriresistens]|uniref:ATP-binding protein n=1 Tax=Paenibacillus alginolyticus TaxID=59839 RepID=UPI001564536C|nr:ATP-binding protein [Paenibacillus frigoriresistens]NRF96199.1 ATP-binding protein [Paenibacillus frigoriresistens]
MKELDLPPYAPLLMESTRALGYSLEAAIADILDNSITARATKISIQFLSYESPYLSILDNGQGMSPEEITSAMRYGSKNPTDTRGENDLGRFGLGLKTASLSQCRKLTVISLKKGVISGRCWDLDHVIKTGKWSLLVLDDEELVDYPDFQALLKQKSGTLVILQSLDRVGNGESKFSTAFSEKMIRVREHLSLVFHRYLSGEFGLKKIKMDINNEPLVPHDPFLSTKSTQVMDDEIINIDNHIIKVRSFSLPHISKLSHNELALLGGKDGLSKQQGFYVYRNKRLLIWGTWFRLMRQDELSKLARVQVDIPNSLDHLWSIDIRKSTASPPEIVRKNLSRIVGRIAERSKKTWTFRGRKETDTSLITLWSRVETRDGIHYDVNRNHPLLNLLKQRMSADNNKYLEHFMKLIEENLPLNALYTDLANDEKFANEQETGLTQDIKEMAELLFEDCKSSEERERFFEKVKIAPPFSLYAEELINHLKGRAV